MLEEVIHFYIIQNIQKPHWLFRLDFSLRILISLAVPIFLGLLIWSIVLYIREKKIVSTSRKYLPRLLGFSFALALSIISCVLFYWRGIY